jgi:hypothetical protein
MPVFIDVAAERTDVLGTEAVVLSEICAAFPVGAEMLAVTNGGAGFGDTDGSTEDACEALALVAFCGGFP